MNCKNKTHNYFNELRFRNIIKGDMKTGFVLQENIML